MSAEGRAENQKLNQTAALLSFGWVFGFQLDLLEKNLITLPELTFSLYVTVVFLRDYTPGRHTFVTIRNESIIFTAEVCTDEQLLDDISYDVAYLKGFSCREGGGGSL